MLADKTLLSVTLAATFASGVFVGSGLRGATSRPGMPPTDPAVVYAPWLEKLESEGYDKSEMAEARQAYGECFKSYDYWWTTFLDVHRDNTVQIEEKREKRLDALAAKHRERAGTK